MVRMRRCEGLLIRPSALRAPLGDLSPRPRADWLKLEFDELWQVALATRYMERRAVSRARPYAAALPADIQVVDAAVERGTIPQVCMPTELTLW
jgi:hypothetical protein